MKTRAEIYGNEAAALLRIPVSICSSFFAFTLAKKKSSRPCSPIYKSRAVFFKLIQAVTFRLVGQQNQTTP